MDIDATMVPDHSSQGSHRVGQEGGHVGVIKIDNGCPVGRNSEFQVGLFHVRPVNLPGNKIGVRLQIEYRRDLFMTQTLGIEPAFRAGADKYSVNYTIKSNHFSAPSG